ncbi:hypothetical protein JTE90_000027 [Oedothorax gibbosus]|uniref:Uncharacterized protein n=1 Tax=Oedothorax gibbosus TaxID=931172 RepID=A0AAV6TM63_9ARAC|nr:hypothetical protein JTE90_000027 [Oedothorax gibbosus]
MLQRGTPWNLDNVGDLNQDHGKQRGLEKKKRRLKSIYHAGSINKRGNNTESCEKLPEEDVEMQNLENQLEKGRPGKGPPLGQNLPQART